ncbi:MAG: tetratricopeptide repeat protein [Bacteroidales bacterium]|nr:tetratricopeptide repeat protein [Bacteroidales bacterium]
MNKRIAIILLAALAALPAHSYNDHRGHKLDSLERAVARWTPDAIDNASTRELLDLNRACRDLMLGYIQLNGEKSMFYARKALAISTAQGWASASADAQRYIGQQFWAMERYDSAMVYFTKAMENIDLMEAGATSPNNPDGYSELEIDDMRSAQYGATGNLYNEMGDIPRAMEYYAKAGAIFDKYGWNTSNSILYYNIGETWVSEGDLKAAEKAYRKALGYAEMEQDSLWIATNHKGLGRVYLERGKMGKALRELHKADEYFASHDREEAIYRKENFEYMSLALRQQKKQLMLIIFAMALAALLAAGVVLLGRMLRASRKEQEETAVVMEETLADLQNSKLPADGIDVQVSDREKEILDLLAKGYTSQQIAECLRLSSETIRWYRKKLLIKFDAANTAELVLRARENNLL